ncbi:cell division protein ZapA [Piscinibacter koreensis]|uniref:Cell division protein ZapA n=1 Tax=Piscinibacter koreensis TaxID=2742824 RepID=A0A7Y6NRT2_9BURK|nr:cell division protein ZapA [Schlegelella koreensis]
MKQVEVTIMGQSYLLGCPDGGEASLLEAVGTVDREMSAIRDGGKVKARERIAVLAALNLAFALAERGSAAAPVPAPQPAPSAADGDGTGAGASTDVAGLMRRIDAALGADGQLL